MTVSYTDAQVYLESLQSSNPSLDDEIQSLLILFNQRLWHQLTDQLDFFFRHEQVVGSVNLVEFGARFVKAFEHRLNPLRFARLNILAAGQINDVTERIEFVRSVIGSTLVEGDAEAVIELTSFLATLFIAGQNNQDAKDLLRELDPKVRDLVTDDSGIYSIYHYAYTEYYRSVGDAQKYYESCLQYLAYTDMNDMETSVRINFAYNFGLAALIGKSMFNFGELLEHPILESLQGTEHEWLGSILSIFNEGNSESWISFQETYKDQLNQVTELVNNIELLEQKIGIMSIISHLFNMGNQSRTISYEELRNVTKRDNSDVETLLMRAMSVGLLRGEIDQVAELVNIDWVQPRVLNMGQIQSLGSQITDWINSVDTLMLQMEANLPAGLQ